MKRHWLYYISPCVLASLFMLIWVIRDLRTEPEGWGWIGVTIGVPVIILLVIASVIIKAVTKGNVLYIWISEAAFLLLLMMILLYRIIL